jgi:hypothetical protein
VAVNRRVAVPVLLSCTEEGDDGEGVRARWAGPGGSRTGGAGQGDGLAAQ